MAERGTNDPPIRWSDEAALGVNVSKPRAKTNSQEHGWNKQSKGFNMTRIVINGSKGRMGQALLSCAARMPDVEIVGAIDQGDDLASVIAKCDAVIEFSFHNATLGVAGCAPAQEGPRRGHPRAHAKGQSGNRKAEGSNPDGHRHELFDRREHVVPG